MATDFPDTTFFIIDDSSVTLPNVKSLVFAEEQGSYLVGAAAALKSTKGNVGFIGGVDTPLLEKFEAGFKAGAKKAKPGITVQSKYLSQPPDFSGFGSPDKGRETANGMYDAGADVVYAAAGGSGVGVFQAALAKGTKAIGVDSDQYQSVGDASLQPVILTSMIKRVDVAVFSALQKFTAEEDTRPVTTYDLAERGRRLRHVGRLRRRRQAAAGRARRPDQERRDHGPHDPLMHLGRPRDGPEARARARRGAYGRLLPVRPR